MSQGKIEFIPPKIKEYLPEGILEARIKKIKETEENHKEYRNVFNICYNCGVQIWVGRDKIGYPEHCMLWYHFDDEYEHIWREGQGEPVCYQCKGKCYCVDKEYKLERIYCEMCKDYVCVRHNNMAMRGTICGDCFNDISLGKKIVKILMKDRPKTLEELYEKIFKD